MKYAKYFPLNQRTVTVKIKRIELCDIMLALTVIASDMDTKQEGREKWIALHDKLEAVLNDFDSKQDF